MNNHHKINNMTNDWPVIRFISQDNFVYTAIELIKICDNSSRFQTWITNFKYILLLLHANHDHYKNCPEVVRVIRMKIAEVVYKTGWEEGVDFLAMWE